MRTIAVIDGNSLMHRAFHAVPPTMNAPDGTPTNAVFGFLSMLLKFVEDEHPDAVICAFDCGRPAFRLNIIDQYKANRPPTDPALKVQFPIIEDILGAMAIPVVKKDGWEGDDILGTVSAMTEASGDICLLVSGDKDIRQLVTERTKVVSTKKGMTDVVIYGPEQVFEEYGVTPAQFPDYLGLIGDKSDNIPGLDGVGPVAAKKLLQAYGNIEGIYEHIDELKGKQKLTFEENKQLAFDSRTVAIIRRDADVLVDLEAAAFPAFTADEVRAGLGKYGMVSHLNKLLALIDEAPAEVEKPALKVEATASESEAMAQLEAAIGGGERLGVAFAESEQASLFGSTISLAVAGEAFAYVFEAETAEDVLVRVLQSGNAAAFDVKRMLRYAMDSEQCADKLSAEGILSAKLYDCALAAYILDSSVGSYGASDVVKRYVDFALPETVDPAKKVLLEAAAAYRMQAVLQEKLQEGGQESVFATIDMPLVPVLALMEKTGAKVDRAQLAELSKSAHAELDTLRQEILGLAGHEFNIDSPSQLSTVLFEELGLKPKKKTSRGYSTDAAVLKELASEHPLPGLILKYREQAKLASTYLDALPRLMDERGLVHSSFNQMATTTGRLSSSDPNLQNIPVRTEFGREVRRAFVPLEPGHVFVSADYSQIELRLLAHLSGDPALIDAFVNGADFHSSTAATVFGVPVEEVTPEMRSKAKAVNFGVVYGQQAFGLAQSLGISFGEAKAFIDRYFESFPGVRKYLDDVVNEARNNGYAETVFGRRRYIAELTSANAQTRAFGERTAMNHPMQGTAADIIKLAMVQVQNAILSRGFSAKMCIQVHDELDFSVAESDLHDFMETVREIMENVVSLRVPLIADVQCGTNWSEAH